MKRLRLSAGGFAVLTIRTLGVGLLALWPGLVAADDVVYFVSGKAMMVKSVEKGPKFYVLEVEGGGKIGVPTELIDRIEPYVIQAPGAVPSVPVAIPAPAAVAPQPSGVPMGGAVPTPAPAAQGQLIPGVGMQPLPAVLAAPAPGSIPGLQGPGVGGKTEPGQTGLGGLRPINIGVGENYATPPARPQPAAAVLGGGPGGSRFMNPNGQMGRAGRPGPGMPGRPGGRGRMMRGYDQPPPQAQQTPAPQAQQTPPPQPPPSTQPQTPSETTEPDPNAAPPEDGTPADDGGAADQGSS